MHANVLVEVGFLSKCLVAAIGRADKRPVPSMRAQVVKEIVPLPEDVLAFFEIALH